MGQTPVTLKVAQNSDEGIQPNDRIVVEAKSWKESKVVIINGILLVSATFIQVFDLLTGANLLQPLVGIFVKDPAQATQVITVMTQIYSLIALYLRTKTYAPVSFK